MNTTKHPAHHELDDVLSLPQEHVFQETKFPWATFIFLAAIFLSQTDWYYSLEGVNSFGTTVDDFTKAIDQVSLWRRLEFSSLGIFAVASILWKGHYRVKIAGALGWLILFLLSWTFLSLAWSTDPAMTFRRLTLLAMCSLGAFAVSQEFSLRDLVLWVFFCTAVYLNVGLVAELVLGTFHPLAGSYRFAGTVHPNEQGLNCALLFFAALSLIATEKPWRGVILVIAVEALIFLFLSKSRTSFFLALIVPLSYWGLTWSAKLKCLVLLWIATLSCLLLLLLGDYISPAFRDAFAMGRTDSYDLSLTGRIPLWGEVLSYISRHPAQGYGYDCFWNNQHIAEVKAEQGWTAVHAHSAYLELGLGLGLVGAIMYILIIILGIRRALVAHKLHSNAYWGFIVVSLTFFAFEGFFEPIILQPKPEMFVIMVALLKLGFSQANHNCGGPYLGTGDQ